MKNPRIFTDNELCGFFDRYNDLCQIEEPAWRWQGLFLVAVLCTCALRINEARLLEVGDCREYPYDLIHVANGKGSRHHPGPKPRDVDVLPQFVPHFRRHVNRLKEMGREYVFVHTALSFERPLSYTQIRDLWYRILEDCGLPKRGTHAGRRSYATYVHRIPFPDENGQPRFMDPLALIEQLGHSDAGLLMTYNQPMPGHRYPNGQKLRWPDHVAPNKEMK